MRLQVVADALVAMLRAEVDGDGDLLRIGDAQAPEVEGGAVGPEMPYAVVYPFDGGAISGESLKHPHTHVEVVYRVLSVGYKRQAAQYMSDLIRAAILDRNASSTEYLNDIVPTDIGIAWRRQVSIGAVTREGTIFNVSDEYALGLVPPPF